MANNTTVQTVCYKWLAKAFKAGQRCPPFSDQASEYWLPLFHHEWSGEMERELAGLARPDAERMQAIATAACHVFTQREAGICADARQIGWEELELALRAGPNTGKAAETAGGE